MPYVIRNHQGAIIAITKEQPLAHNEFLDAQHPDIVMFLNSESGRHSAATTEPSVQQQLLSSDLALSRAIDDLIQLLIDKNTIMFTELPPAVQEKLLTRRRLRSELKGGQGFSFDEDEGLI